MKSTQPSIHTKPAVITNNATKPNAELSSKAILLGSEKAEITFYLPTPPKVSKAWHWQNTNAIEQIINDNGNHWRKIFTIMAKIAVSDKAPDTWRDCRNQLFNPQAADDLKRVNFSQCNIIINATKLSVNSHIHIICGQAAFANISDQSFISALTAIDESQKIMAHEQILITPYLDYRQFPNVLIEQLRRYLSSLKQSLL
ncbi:DUF6942 family protein [Shewanella sp. 10N.286.48.A6]|uniref:DUF6942 family protein n=1 Tax=Shewanella sp. 10N.286.48.A6 TaxID=1880833 RepID=UPI001F533893|nr:hypothetical protein [Shewanella sp. 10N.286.48.A6]